MHVWVCVSVYYLILKQEQRVVQDCYLPAKIYLQVKLNKQNFDVKRFVQENRVKATNQVPFFLAVFFCIQKFLFLL